MLISTLSSGAAIQSQQNIQRTSARLQSVIETIVTGDKVSADNVANLSVASRLQASVSGLRQVSSNLAQLSSLTQVADNSVAQIAVAIGELKNLAEKANGPVVNDENRRALNESFTAVVKQIDTIVATTRFNNKLLLDGSLRGERALSLGAALAADDGLEEGLELNIDDLSSTTLLKNAAIGTSEQAANALSLLSNAANTLSSVRANIGSFQQTIDYSSAVFDSALFNQQAALSDLKEADLASASTVLSQQSLQQDIQTSLAAQGNRLPANLLRLIS